MAQEHGPPMATFGGTMPMKRLITRTESVAIVLVEIRAFPTGCTFEIVTALRRGVPNTDWLLDDDERQLKAALMSGGGEDGESPTFGVEFHDGTPPVISGSPYKSDLPSLIPLRGHAGRVQSDLLEISQSLWLSPLPPAEPFDFIAEWQMVDIGTTRSTIQGAHIMEASAQSESYWS